MIKMRSTFSWLDFAESDRQRAMQVIELFREKSTLDELGFGPVRDTLADAFFPGTSTIQTRARYFLFVPWIMRDSKLRKCAPQDFAKYVRQLETKLIGALLANDRDQGGIIGREALGTLKRMPSSIYWRGLHSWGIRRFAGSIDQFGRELARNRFGAHTVVVSDEGEPQTAPVVHWHIAIPDEPPDFLSRTTFALTAEEAEFLKERICASHPSSLLAHVVTGATESVTAEFAWDDSVTPMVSVALRESLEHARRFSLCALGGPLLYTLMLARMKRSDELEAALTNRLHSWRDQVAHELVILKEWDRSAFWMGVQRANPRLSPRTKEFSERWIDVALRGGAGTPVWDEHETQKLVSLRERQLKGARARLAPENQRARDRWQGDAAVSPMDYRWRQTRTIVNDIVAGLHGQQEAAGVSDA